MESESWSAPLPSDWKNIDTYLAETDRDVELVDSERYVSYSLDDLYPSWQEDAHCKGVGHKYYFGDEQEQPTMSIKQVRRAAKLCDVCPVYEQCLRWSLEKREYYGVWAGTSGRTRKKIFRIIDSGTATVDEIVGRFLDGQGDRFRNRTEPGTSPIRPSTHEAGDSVRDAASG